jgi:hypothetical protein
MAFGPAEKGFASRYGISARRVNSCAHKDWAEHGSGTIDPRGRIA